MRLLLNTSLLLFCLASAAPAVFAFDNDLEINKVTMDEENFLDIKAHRFRKSLEYQWFDNTTGWRMTGASLNADITFLQTELKLQHELSGHVNFRLEVEQEMFYADKEFPLPKTEIEIYPWASDLGFSLLGTSAYEKKDTDLGIALIWGRRPWNYLRLEYLNVDSLYNQKNVSDNTYFRKEPKTLSIEGAYQMNNRYKLRFAFSRDKPLELIDPDSSGVFTHESNNYFLLFDYQPSADSVIGLTINGFSLDKSSSQIGVNQQQATDYISADTYWVRGMRKPYEIRIGAQFDRITNDYRDFMLAGDSLDYTMKALQAYTTVYHPFNEHMAWDMGLYVGHVVRKQNYLSDDGRDTSSDGVEAKFRMGFEYSSSDGRSSLQFNISLNLDDLYTDPGDGGGISFQSVF